MVGMKLPALRLYVAIVLLTVVGAWISAPVALASAQGDACSMTCCTNRAACTCPAHRARSARKSRGEAIGHTTLARPCPEGCTQSSFTVRSFVRELLGPASHRLA